MRRFPLHVFALFCASLGFAFTAQAQTLVHSYYFNGDLSDSTGSTTLVSNGGSLATNGVYTFGVTQGLQFTPSGSEAGLLHEYTIGLRFYFDDVSSYRKVIDFSELLSEEGVYVAGGAFTFFDTTGTSGSVSSGSYVDFILTRDSGGMVKGYVGTSLELTFADTSDAVSSNSFWFFRDDIGGNFENGSGAVATILIYNGAVAPENISLVVDGLSAVPEPSTWALLTATPVLAFALWRRRAATAHLS